MPRRAVPNIDSLHRPVGPVSHGVIADNGPLIFVSGQIPLAADGTLVGPDDIVAQYRQAIGNIEKVVVAGGGSMDDVVSLVNYVTIPLRADTPEYLAMAAIREEVFSPPAPASTLVEVGSLMVPGAMVEVEAIAVLSGVDSGQQAAS